MITSMKLKAAGAVLGMILAAGPALADERGAEVEAFLREYTRLWNAGDAAAITDHVYKFDTTNPMSQKAGLEAQFAQLKAQGYDHSVIESVEACLLSENLALGEMRYSRLKTDGTAMPPKDRTTLYKVRRTPAGWRIAELMTMDSSAEFTCKSPKTVAAAPAAPRR